MNQLVFIENGKTATDSLTVADVFKKRHADVLRSIDNLECSKEFNERNFALVDYIDGKGESRRKVVMSQDGFSFLVMGYTGKEAARFKEMYISEFNRMRDQLNKSQSKISDAEKLEIQKQRAEAMLKNAQARQAKLIFDVTHRFRDRLPDVTVESLIAAGTKTLTGQELLPSPKVEQKFHTCEEIAKRLGAMSKKGLPHNKAIAALIKNIGFAETEVVTVVESAGSWQGTTDKYSDSVISRLEQKLIELGYPPVLNLDKSFSVIWKKPA